MNNSKRSRRTYALKTKPKESKLKKNQKAWMSRKDSGTWNAETNMKAKNSMTRKNMTFTKQALTTLIIFIL